MKIKLFLLMLLCLMVSGAIYFNPSRGRTLLGEKISQGPRLKIMTWNVGYADLYGDSKAHIEDMRKVASVILGEEPDVVALQELADTRQLNVLVSHLGGKYRAQLGSRGNTDRMVALLVKFQEAEFEDVPTDIGRRALAARFKLSEQSPEIIVISAHADAFSSHKRRVYTGNVVDWAQSHDGPVFIAGDFNFEINIDKQPSLFTDNAKNDSEAYSYLLRYFRDLGKRAGATAANDRRIDYIFGSNDRVNLWNARVLTGAVTGKMDHRPLVVEVSVV